MLTLKLLIRPPGLGGLAGCRNTGGEAAPTAKTGETKEPPVVRKDGWILIAPPPSVCVEQEGEITIIRHGSYTRIQFGTKLPESPTSPEPPVPPPTRLPPPSPF